MTFNTNSVVAALRLTAVLALGFAATLPAQAGPILKQPTEPAPPIVYPTCPGGFTLAQKGAHIFRCKITVPTNQTHVPVFNAVNHSCAPVSYWNIGPQVYTQASGANTTVYFRCRHT